MSLQTADDVFRGCRRGLPLANQRFIIDSSNQKLWLFQLSWN